MIATVEQAGKIYRVGEYDAGDIAFAACDRFINRRGWTNVKKHFENTDDDFEKGLKF